MQTSTFGPRTLRIIARCLLVRKVLGIAVIVGRTRNVEDGDDMLALRAAVQSISKGVGQLPVPVYEHDRSGAPDHVRRLPITASSLASSH